MTVRKDTRKLQDLIRTTSQSLDKFGRSVSTEMVTDIKVSFGAGHQKGTRTRDSRGRFVAGERSYDASAPGDPPNVDTGALRGSIRWEPDGRHRYLIHDGVEYGVYLELGTEKMAARPFIAPVFEEWRQRKFGQFAKDFGIYD